MDRVTTLHTQSPNPNYIPILTPNTQRVMGISKRYQTQIGSDKFGYTQYRILHCLIKKLDKIILTTLYKKYKNINIKHEITGCICKQNWVPGRVFRFGITIPYHFTHSTIPAKSGNTHLQITGLVDRVKLPSLFPTHNHIQFYTSTNTDTIYIANVHTK